MKTFFVIFTDAVMGLSVDCYCYRLGRLQSAVTFFNVTHASANRLRKIFRASRKSVTVFDIWSRRRVEGYRTWCKRRDGLGDRFPSLDHLETSGPHQPEVNG